MAEPAKATTTARAPVDAERAIGLLRTMWRIRLFEERVAQLKRTLQVHGLIHLSIGGEGVAAAVCGQLRDEDAVYSGHRAHGHAIAKGAPLPRMMAELMGRADGLCRGLGGSMHLVDAEHGFMGATGVVGGNLPLAVGTALAARLDQTARATASGPAPGRGSGRVTVVFFGDGAVQAGQFSESVNLAALWQLPLIFVCENNGFAEFTSREEHSTIERVSDVVAAYGFERATVSGSDVPAVYEAFGEFLGQARAGQGPMLLECLTYRRRGHYEGDPEKYRDPLAEQEWAERDPLAQLQKRALAEGWIGADDAARLEQEAGAEVEAAVRFGRDSPFPDTALAAGLVYADAAEGEDGAGRADPAAGAHPTAGADPTPAGSGERR